MCLLQIGTDPFKLSQDAFIDSTINHVDPAPMESEIGSSKVSTSMGLKLSEGYCNKDICLLRTGDISNSGFPPLCDHCCDSGL